MKKYSLLLALGMLILGGVVPAIGGEIDVDLEIILESTPPEQVVSVLFYLSEQVNLSAISEEMDNLNATLQLRHETVIRALQEKAGSTQGNIIAYLSDAKDDGRISEFKAFWITNAIRIEATKAEIEMIANRSDVAMVYYNYEIELVEPVNVKGDIPNDITTIEIGVQAVRAPEVWALGFTGEGVLVANMDTGVEGSHPALADRWAGVADPRYAGHPEWAWYDPYAGQNDFPYDDGGHGTHTMGSVCGASPTTGDTVGVAPGAFWIASAPIDRGGGIPRTVADAILSFEWMVDPDGNPETNWDVPAVCSNSWGLTTGHGYPPCDELFWSYLDACEAAGTVILFSAGNEASSGLRRPADRATDAYRTCAVAAVDANNPNWPIASFSSRGPTYCTPEGDAAIKPDIAAPGVDVRSCYPGGGYTTMSGTSMASPHVNGVVALIRQANPNLSVEMIKQIIYDTAYDLGPPGEDNSYGWGMIDAYEAVQMALSFLEGYGAIKGRLTDQVNGDVLPGIVTVTNRDPVLIANCNQDGYYTLFAPSDSVWELKAEYTEEYLPAFASITVPENDTIFQDFALEPKVDVVLRASFGNPEDISYRTFYSRGSWDDDGFYNSNWPSSFTAMMDNGVNPDEIAGDGVFTGLVKLATDLENTYTWAVYSENYNGDASQLQYGADFDITSPGDPPVVPILEVNPSGSENNWTLTVDGDNDLVIELQPDYNNQPYAWFGDIILNANITYTFRIFPMHSGVASYGEGGVGGIDFVVTPHNTEDYTFIFNDNTDILVIDSEHPSPSGLSATQDMDMKIELDWDHPRLDPESYLIYRSDNESGPFSQIDTLPYPQQIHLDEPVNNYQDYYYHVAALYSDGIESIRSNIVHGYAITGARLIVSPGSFEVDVFPGSTLTANMYISNNGDLDLIYDITITQEGIPQVISGGQNEQKPFERIENDNEKTFIRSGPRNPPQILDSGGPDAFGYAWIDSDDPDGPVFDWIDISTIGVPIDFGADIDDGNSGPIPLEFTFKFYGNDFNSINICSNGWASFTDSTSVEWGNQPMPHPEPPNNMLAAFYDDLNFEHGGTGYFYTNNVDTAIITWDHVPDWRQEGIFTFQIILIAPAKIIYQYFEVGPGRLDENSIGIENESGTVGLQVANDESYIHNNMAIQFYKNWLRTDPNSGVVEPNAADTIAITFDAYSLLEGDYTGFINVSGHDIYHDEDPVNVAVTMHVTEQVDVPEIPGSNLPTSYVLYQNYPNPFNNQTTILFDLPKVSFVTVEVYNLLGRKVTSLVNSKQSAGSHSVIWNAEDFSSGVYFYKLKAGDHIETKKMVLLK